MPSDFTYSLVILRPVLWGHFLIRFAHVPTASTTVVTYYVYCLSRTIHGACLWELGHFHLHFSHLTRNLPNPWVVTQFSSVAQSCCSLQPHELQHARPSWPSPTPGVHPNPCLLSQWCHPTISSSVIPFSSCPQSFPASGSFQISQLFASGGQILEFQLQNQSHQWTPRTDLP